MLHATSGLSGVVPSASPSGQPRRPGAADSGPLLELEHDDDDEMAVASMHEQPMSPSIRGSAGMYCIVQYLCCTASQLCTMYCTPRIQLELTDGWRGR